MQRDLRVYNSAMRFGKGAIDGAGASGLSFSTKSIQQASDRKQTDKMTTAGWQSSQDLADQTKFVETAGWTPQVCEAPSKDVTYCTQSEFLRVMA